MARKTAGTRGTSRVILVAALALATGLAGAVTALTSGSTGAAPAAEIAATVSGGPASDAPALAVEPGCPTGETYVAPEDVGVEGMQTCLPVGAALTDSHVDPLYGTVAHELLQQSAPLDERLDVRQPTVACWNLADWKQIIELLRAQGSDLGTSLLGWVTPTNRVINLSVYTCRRLDAIAHAGQTPGTRVAASSVGTLAHETIHLGGIPHEGTADCYAKQLTRYAAELIGATDRTARVTARLSAEYMHQERAGTEYDDPDCYDGGPLDLDLDGTWL
ncbi:MAG: hypothetical protein ACE5EV_01330 [Gaiellales bacterium]